MVEVVSILREVVCIMAVNLMLDVVKHSFSAQKLRNDVRVEGTVVLDLYFEEVFSPLRDFGNLSRFS